MMEKSITKIDALPQLERKINVAAYARVSSGKDAMLHSLSNQISYYNEKIKQNDEWLFIGIYADEAFTGTKDNRPEFQRMIEDCRQGKIDMVITKSISRFARNTMTLLEVVRELKSIDVDVYFEEQNIHTMSNEGEMILTFLASFAQEESRSFSENMKWRIRRDFEQGIVWGYKDCLGYKIVNKKLIVKPEEAELVKRIFNMYLDGCGFEMIAKILTKEKIPTPYKKEVWGKTAVQHIIGNYTYTGDLLLQKTFRENHLSKKKKKNKGEQNQFLVENDHEAIISKKDYYRAVEMRIQKAQEFKLNERKVYGQYPLTSMIRCAKCGENFRHKTTPYNKKWVCGTSNFKGKDYCHSKAIPEDVLDALIADVLNTSLPLDEKIVKSKIEYIEAFDGNKVVIHFLDGHVKEEFWKDHTRKNSWTPEMKEAARKRAYKQYNKEGE